MHYVPFINLKLRCSDETEIIGVDDGEMGEFAYDYVGLDTEPGPRPIFSGNVVATGGYREPIPHSPHEVKSSPVSDQRSDSDSHYPLNLYPLKAMRA